tara:strand:- start:3118 stop:3831 length:714 start_codon:yes stop_codon:yes gene_type:complete
MKNLVTIILDRLDHFIQKKNIQVLKKNLSKKIDLYVDVGAHNGEMINTILNNFTVKKILAFEPNPECLNTLKKIKKNNLKIFEFALGNKKGKVDLNIGYISSMSSINNIDNKSFYSKLKKIIIGIFYFKSSIYKKKIKIKVKTLSEILIKNKFKKIDLLKIDTEGYEFNVLNGLENFLEKTKIILLECHYDDSLIKNYNLSSLNSFFINNRFKLISKNKMLLRKGYELIYKNQRNFN